MPRSTFPLLLSFAAVLAGSVPSAQSVADVRADLGRSLRDSKFAASFAGLIFLSDELELSGARYEIDDDIDTDVRVLSFPYRTTVRPWGSDRPGLYLEGAVGYARAERSTDDLYEGAVPSAVTSIDASWTTIGGLIGAGPQFELAPDLTLAPIVNLGLAHIESNANYGGPGATVSSALLDGLAFNWDGWVGILGGATRIDWTEALTDEIELEVIGRYDLRWSQTFDTDDRAQEFTSRQQLVTLRADLVGPSGIHVGAAPLGWRLLSGYRHFAEGSLYGVRDIVLLGATLELDAEGVLPVLGSFAVNAGMLLGENLTGYTLGVSVGL